MSIASDLTALCSAQTTLIDDVLAQSILADVPASSMNTLGSFNSNQTQKTVQLGAGGDATLSVPVQDGISFRFVVAGYVYNPTPGVGLHVVLWLNGSQTGFIVDIGGDSTNPDSSFYFEGTLFWTSSDNIGLAIGQSVYYRTASGVSYTATNEAESISSPSTFDFKVNGYVDGSASSATLTVTEFRALVN